MTACAYHLYKLKRRQAESETEIKQKNKERDRLRRIIAGYGQQQISLYEKYKSGELSKDISTSANMINESWRP